MTAVKVTDHSTKAELEEALGHLARRAQREPHVFGVTGPSEWDARHFAIDDLLDQRERLTAQS